MTLIQGISYELDFFQDFSACQFDGSMIWDISTSDLCRLLDEKENIAETNAADNHHVSTISYQQHQKLLSLIEKASQRERKEELWEKKHNKKSCKKAYKKLEVILKDWGVDD